MSSYPEECFSRRHRYYFVGSVFESRRRWVSAADIRGPLIWVPDFHHGPLAARWEGSTANLHTKILDFRGFDSSAILILRGGILRSIGSFPESLSQRILVGIISVGRLGVWCDLWPGPARGARVGRTGQIHININNLTTISLDNIGFPLKATRTSNLSKQQVFKLFMFMWTFRV